LRGIDGCTPFRGYYETFPIAKAFEPTTLLVYEMNGGPIPRIHGFPLRLIVPGLRGEKNPKWGATDFGGTRESAPESDWTTAGERGCSRLRPSNPSRGKRCLATTSTE